MRKKINLNQADVSELMSTGQIGKKEAEAILSYRQEHGGFDSVADLKAMHLLGTKEFDAIKGRLTVE